MFISDDRLHAIASSLKPRSQYDFNECSSLADILIQAGHDPTEIKDLNAIEQLLFEKYGLHHCPCCGVWTDEKHSQYTCRRCYDFDND